MGPDNNQGSKSCSRQEPEKFPGALVLNREKFQTLLELSGLSSGSASGCVHLEAETAHQTLTWGRLAQEAPSSSV